MKVTVTKESLILQKSNTITEVNAHRGAPVTDINYLLFPFKIFIELRSNQLLGSELIGFIK